LERAIPARWLPSVSGTGRDHREGNAEAAAACLADPVSGLIDGDPGLDQEAIHQERDWDAFTDQPPTNNDHADAKPVAVPNVLAVAVWLKPQVRGNAYP
jgi:hypothetical protein